MHRENLKEVIDFLETLPDEHFNMRTWAKKMTRRQTPLADHPKHWDACNTIACIGGWTVYVHRGHSAIGKMIGLFAQAKRILELEEHQAQRLFMPSVNLDRVPLRLAINVLKTLHKTGKIMWRPEAKKLGVNIGFN